MSPLTVAQLRQACLVTRVTSADRALLHSGDGHDRTPTCDLWHVTVVVLVMPKKVEENYGIPGRNQSQEPGLFLVFGGPVGVDGRPVWRRRGWQTEGRGAGDDPQQAHSQSEHPLRQIRLHLRLLSCRCAGLQRREL